jgi:ankyrin repeat protein
MSKKKSTKSIETPHDSFDAAIARHDAQTVSTTNPIAPPLILSPVDQFFNDISAKNFDEKKLVKTAQDNPEFISHINTGGFNALTFALISKKNVLALALVKIGSDVTQCSTNMGWNPLVIAAGTKPGKDQIANMLLDKGASPNAKTHYGLYALTAACTYANLPLAQRLLKMGAEHTPADVWWPPVIAAAGSGNLELIKLIESAGADLNRSLAPKNGFTPLHHAVRNGHNDICAYLISKNVDVNAMNNEGNTPLHMAAERDHAEICKMLIKAGAQTALENVSGKIASELTKDAAIIKAISTTDDKNRIKHHHSGKKNIASLADMPDESVKEKKLADKKSANKKIAASVDKKTANKKAPSKSSKTPVKIAMKALTDTAAKKIAAKPKPTSATTLPTKKIKI